MATATTRTPPTPETARVGRVDLTAYERRFRRSGLPLFIEDYSATHDIFTRATPLFVLVFLAEMIGATSLDWTWWQNVLAALGGLALLIGGFGLLNRLRRRPFWSLPTRFGIPELAVFVLLPALLPLVFEGQLRQFFGIAAGNLVLAGLVYLVVGYGLSATIFWGLTRLAGELATSLAKLVRALPLLLVFSLVLFVNTEMWQVFSGMPLSFLLIAIGLFGTLGLAFLIIRVPAEVSRIERDAGEDGPPLRTRQRFNVGLTLVVSQLMQVIVVSAGVGAFFIAFGMVAIGDDIYAAWEIDPGAWSARPRLLGEQLVLTESLLRVAVGIATFTGLYYAIALITDATYREEFLSGVVEDLREVFSIRAEYLTVRDTGQVSQSPSGPIAK
jgi:hypothetical protein